MKNKQYYIFTIICCFLFLTLVYVGDNVWRDRQKMLHMTMLNIGQGDAFYIRTPHGNDILVDGGPDRSVLWELGRTMPPYDHTLELVIATHPDADHIAGITELPDTLNIHTLITNGRQKDTAFSAALNSLSIRADPFAQAGIHTLHAHKGMELTIEEDVWLEFLHPHPKIDSPELNDDSVVFILHYKSFKALFVGDISSTIEQELAQLYGTALDSDVLKVSHHGSHTGTSTELLQAVTPKAAFISAGLQNRYGHPHAGPLYRLQQAGIEVFRTDQHGRVTCTTNGKSFSCASSAL